MGGPHGGRGGDQTQMGGLLWRRVEAPLIKLKGCIVIKFLRDYKKSGFSLHRLRRMNRPLNRSPEGFLECTECGTIYNYPRVEMGIGLVGPIPPLSFCSRRCFDKFLNRVRGPRIDTGRVQGRGGGIGRR